MREPKTTNRDRTYAVWVTMQHACHNVDYNNYRYYGKKKVAVCARWRHSFENFVADMGIRSSEYTLIRLDKRKNYSPSNCCWIKRSENKFYASMRKTLVFTFCGVTLKLSTWATELGWGKPYFINRLARSNTTMAKIMAIDNSRNKMVKIAEKYKKKNLPKNLYAGAKKITATTVLYKTKK